MIFEDYNRDVHPGIQEFWAELKRSNHTFARHPILAEYGDEMSREAFFHLYDSLRRMYPDHDPEQLVEDIMPMAQEMFVSIMRVERPHRSELEQLAVQLVCSIWDAPPEMFDAKIVSDVQLIDANDQGGPSQENQGQENQDQEDQENQDQIGDYDEADEYDDYDFGADDLTDEINKRITMNALTQGAAIHNMLSMHHIIADKLNEIDDSLVDVYSKFASSSSFVYWIINTAAMANLADFTVGSSKVSYDNNLEYEYEEDENEDEDEDEMPKVIARAVNFPILVQELVKGLMEVLSLHGLAGMSADQLRTIYRHADVLSDEPYLIQIGHHLWRSFLKIVPRGHKLVDVIVALASQSPEYVHNLLASTIEAVHDDEDPESAREALVELMQQLEDDDVADFDEDDYEEVSDWGSTEWSPDEDGGEWSPDEDGGEWSPDEDGGSDWEFTEDIEKSVPANGIWLAAESRLPRVSIDDLIKSVQRAITNEGYSVGKFIIEDYQVRNGRLCIGGVMETNLCTSGNIISNECIVVVGKRI